MEPIKSVSSRLMTPLLFWRNHKGHNETWRSQYSIADNQNWEFRAKKIATDIALPLLLTTAFAESTLYSSLTLASLSVYPISKKPFQCAYDLLSSSFFTIVWSLFNLGMNHQEVYLSTRECFARRGITISAFMNDFPTSHYSLNFNRDQDARHIRQIHRNYEELLRQRDERATRIFEASLEVFHNREPSYFQKEVITRLCQLIENTILPNYSNELKKSLSESDYSSLVAITSATIAKLALDGVSTKLYLLDLFTENTRNFINSNALELEDDERNKLFETFEYKALEVIECKKLPQKPTLNKKNQKFFTEVTAITHQQLQSNDFFVRNVLRDICQSLAKELEEAKSDEPENKCNDISASNADSDVVFCEAIPE